MKIGYARTSTVDQEAGFDAQLRDLGADGCEKMFAGVGVCLGLLAKGVERRGAHDRTAHPSGIEDA